MPGLPVFTYAWQVEFLSSDGETSYPVAAFAGYPCTLVGVEAFADAQVADLNTTQPAQAPWSAKITEAHPDTIVVR